MSIPLSVFAAGGFMAGLGVTLATVLAVANRRLHVYEDPRIDEVEGLLPASNCGACGQAGCRPFAQALIAGVTEPARCTVNNAENAQLIADTLGVDVGAVEKRIPRLACAGGNNVARHHAHYIGLPSCHAAAQLGGSKGCAWGCLGLADCETACRFDAIQMTLSRLPVVDTALCTACGDCVAICPRDLFSLQPISRRLWVACRNPLSHDEAEAQCAVACTGCERCAADAADGLITVENNLAVVNYALNNRASPDAIQRCPTGAIVWLDLERGLQRGARARKVVRQSALPVG